MSSYLYRLGHWAFRRRWIVVGFWLALLVVDKAAHVLSSGWTSRTAMERGAVAGQRSRFRALNPRSCVTATRLVV